MPREVNPPVKFERAKDSARSSVKGIPEGIRKPCLNQEVILLRVPSAVKATELPNSLKIPKQRMQVGGKITGRSLGRHSVGGCGYELREELVGEWRQTRMLTESSNQTGDINFKVEGNRPFDRFLTLMRHEEQLVMPVSSETLPNVKEPLPVAQPQGLRMRYFPIGYHTGGGLAATQSEKAERKADAMKAPPAAEEPPSKKKKTEKKTKSPK